MKLIRALIKRGVEGRLQPSAGTRLLSQEAQPPAALNPEVPPALSALVLRLLAKKPEDRVQSAAELVERLAPLG